MLCRFNERLTQLSTALETLTGDSILTAATVTYACMLPWSEKQAILETWKAVLTECSIPFDPAYTLCNFMRTTNRHDKLLPKQVLMDDTMEHSLYCYALVRSPSLSHAHASACTMRRTCLACGPVSMRGA